MNLLQLRPEQHTSPENLAGLRAYLAQLIGETFRFARVSFGDELTLHFGDLRPARSPKLPMHLFGAYILGVRGSPWLLKSGSEPKVVSDGIDLDCVQEGLGQAFHKDELEANPLIQPESRVISVSPFVVKPMNGFGVQLQFSDGTTFHVLPTLPEVDDPEDEALPQLADWEFISPNGLLNAGPGLNWSFKPTALRTPLQIDLD